MTNSLRRKIEAAVSFFFQILKLSSTKKSETTQLRAATINAEHFTSSITLYLSHGNPGFTWRRVT